MGRVEVYAVHVAQRVGQPPGTDVVLGQTVHVMGQRMARRRREYASLTHRTAETLLPSPGAVDKVFLPGQSRAHGCAEAFGKVDPNAIER